MTITDYSFYRLYHDAEERITRELEYEYVARERALEQSEQPSDELIGRLPSPPSLRGRLVRLRLPFSHRKGRRVAG